MYEPFSFNSNTLEKSMKHTHDGLMMADEVNEGRQQSLSTITSDCSIKRPLIFPCPLFLFPALYLLTVWNAHLFL